MITPAQGTPTAAMVDRRSLERRADRKKSLALIRAFAMFRAFGLPTALALLLRTGLDETEARALLATKQDRRRRTGRR